MIVERCFDYRVYFFRYISKETIETGLIYVGLNIQSLCSKRKYTLKISFYNIRKKIFRLKIKPLFKQYDFFFANRYLFG